jgi:hypothetical protein
VVVAVTVTVAVAVEVGAALAWDIGRVLPLGGRGDSGLARGSPAPLAAIQSAPRSAPPARGGAAAGVDTPELRFPAGRA